MTIRAKGQLSKESREDGICLTRERVARGMAGRAAVGGGHVIDNLIVEVQRSTRLPVNRGDQSTTTKSGSRSERRRQRSEQRSKGRSGGITRRECIARHGRRTLPKRKDGGIG